MTLQKWFSNTLHMQPFVLPPFPSPASSSARRRQSGRQSHLYQVALSNFRGVACLKINVRNCVDVVNALMQRIKKKMEHLQIALTKMRRRKRRRLIRVCAICHVKYIRLTILNLIWMRTLSAKTSKGVLEQIMPSYINPHKFGICVSTHLLYEAFRNGIE